VKRVIAYLLLGMMMLSPHIGHGDGLKTLLMPGKLTASHSEFEADCDACHDTSSKARQAKLCMDCHDHDNILDDIANKKGFHGRLGNSLAQNCKHCHTDHKGRDFDIAPLNRTTFDHSQTDFVLKGAHSNIKCDSCHDSGERYSEAPSTCYGCHQDSDVHDGKQGKKCDSCHGTVNWKQSTFEHDKTDFPLKGAHKDTLCSSCHINKEYKDTPQQCVSCHGIQDVHLKTFGSKCDTCHSSERWDRARYDHDKNTGFPLLGKHNTASCNGCHEPGSKADKTPDTCFDCHRYDDHHKGRFGKACEDCHTPKSWSKKKFDHDQTRFPLTGRHSDISCNYCHRGDIEHEQLATDCHSCHKANDIHEGKLGKRCDECHGTQSWQGGEGFDHDLALFPLIGMHASTQCEECHLSSQYSETDSSCHSCHEQDDTHEGRLGTACGTCHNPNAWDAWIFDHDKATGFELGGAHEKLACYDCHRSTTTGILDASADCISCHRNDDSHGGQFGRRCEQCHNTVDFSEVDLTR